MAFETGAHAGKALQRIRAQRLPNRPMALMAIGDIIDRLIGETVILLVDET